MMGKSENLVAAVGSVVGGAQLFLVQSAWFWVPMMVLMTLDYVSGIAAAAMDGDLDTRKLTKGMVKKLFLLALMVAALAMDVGAQGFVEKLGYDWQQPYLTSAYCLWVGIREAISFLGNTVKAGAISKREGKRARGFLRNMQEKLLELVAGWLAPYYRDQEVDERD